MAVARSLLVSLAAALLFLSASTAASAANAPSCTAKVNGKRPDKAPSWAFALVPDGGLLKACARGEKEMFIVEFSNPRDYGVVLRYGSGVKFGWAKGGFGLRTLYRQISAVGADGLYVPPRGRASFGVLPGMVKGPASFVAKATALSTFFDPLIVGMDLAADKTIEKIAKNDGCAAAVKTLVTHVGAATKQEVLDLLEALVPSTFKCMLEIEAQEYGNLLKASWRKKALKIVKWGDAAAKAKAVAEMVQEMYDKRQDAAQPLFVTVVPRAASGPFTEGGRPDPPVAHEPARDVPGASGEPVVGGEGGSSVSERRVTLAQGPIALKGYRYAISLAGFPPHTAISVSCHDSANPNGFYEFSLTTDAAGSAFTQTQCYSADGPAHWAVADGIRSNSVAWSADGSGAVAPPARVWPQQQGSRGANTFTNPYNASGMGAKIAAMSWVDVSCKVYAPQIQSANPDGYWYRIASPPWNNSYYAVANTFWNGDVPGQRPYTHNTDFAVPDC